METIFGHKLLFVHFYTMCFLGLCFQAYPVISLLSLTLIEYIKLSISCGLILQLLFFRCTKISVSGLCLMICQVDCS